MIRVSISTHIHIPFYVIVLRIYQSYHKTMGSLQILETAIQALIDDRLESEDQSTYQSSLRSTAFGLL